jgi:hypothetical protein
MSSVGTGGAQELSVITHISSTDTVLFGFNATELLRNIIHVGINHVRRGSRIT